jgi:hypothetical protein
MFDRASADVSRLERERDRLETDIRRTAAQLTERELTGKCERLVELVKELRRAKANQVRRRAELEAQEGHG